MPTYQYACPDCGYKFELKQKFSDDPVKRCPRCERRHVYRVVGPVAVSFKGTGWYITDSKTSAEKKTLDHKPKEPAANGNGTNGNGTSESTASTETKPAESTSKSASEKATTDKAEKPAAPAKKE